MEKNEDHQCFAAKPPANSRSSEPKADPMCDSPGVSAVHNDKKESGWSGGVVDGRRRQSGRVVWTVHACALFGRVGGSQTYKERRREKIMAGGYMAILCRFQVRGNPCSGSSALTEDDKELCPGWLEVGF